MRSLIVLICIIACNTPPVNLYSKLPDKTIIRQCDLPVLYVFNKEIPKRMQDITHKAVEYWNSVYGGKLFFYGGIVDYKIDDPETGALLLIDIFDRYKDKYGLIKLDSSLASTKFKANRRGCISANIEIFADILDNRLDENGLQTVMRHELGHTLGLGHSDKLLEDGLMEDKTSFGSLKELSEYELKAFRLIY
jgi:hypothetical protein